MKKILSQFWLVVLLGIAVAVSATQAADRNAPLPFNYDIVCVNSGDYEFYQSIVLGDFEGIKNKKYRALIEERIDASAQRKEKIQKELDAFLSPEDQRVLSGGAKALLSKRVGDSLAEGVVY